MQKYRVMGCKEWMTLDQEVMMEWNIDKRERGQFSFVYMKGTRVYATKKKLQYKISGGKLGQQLTMG